MTPELEMNILRWNVTIESQFSLRVIQNFVSFIKFTTSFPTEIFPAWLWSSTLHKWIHLQYVLKNDCEFSILQGYCVFSACLDSVLVFEKREWNTFRFRKQSLLENSFPVPPYRKYIGLFETKRFRGKLFTTELIFLYHHPSSFKQSEVLETIVYEIKFISERQILLRSSVLNNLNYIVV